MTPPQQHQHHWPSSLQLLLLLSSAHAFIPAHAPTAPVTAFFTSTTVISSLSSRSPLSLTSIPSARTPLPCLWQIRSDQQHTEDYFRFIEGKEAPEKVDQPSVIIGKGKLGQALAEWSTFGKDDVLVDRGETIPLTLTAANGTVYESFPIYVCVHEWQVEEVILACPKEKRNDLVFMQSACLENLLKRYGLCNKKTTQCVPYFSVSPLGLPIDGRVQYDVSKTDGEPKYAGQTSVCGLWRGAVAERLKKKGLHVVTMDYMYWRKQMLERLLFDSVFGLLACVHAGSGEKTYGELAQNHWEEIDDILSELNRAVANIMAVVLLTHVDRRLRGLAEGPSWRDKRPRMATAQEYPYRNGVLRSLSRTFTSRGFPSPMATHDEYLNFAKERKLVLYDVDMER